MRVNELQRYSLPARIVKIWQEQLGETLLPVQQKAIACGLLERDAERGRRLIISAPTSSGKSFCAEMAIAKALTQRRKALFLLPLKSLAEEKYRSLKETYKSLGVKILIATGDHPEYDERLAKGDYQVAVAIYEKIDLLLCSNLDALKNIGLIVIDEFQMIAEEGRGAILERLLTKVIASGYQPDLLALSAVIADESVARLAQWLSAEVVCENRRPVDLQCGVAANGTLHYRYYNSGEEGTEPFRAVQPGEDALEAFVDQLAHEPRSTLIFVKSRSDTVNLAFKLAASVKSSPATKAIEALGDEEPSFLIRTLKQTLSRGVGFHNSDLSPSQRRTVEQAFADKEITALFSTTTLAMGVNLPAETVYLETVKYASGRFDRRPSLVPVSRAEFDNMAGRAGRLGLNNNQPGRAVILAETEFDRDILWEQYIAPVSSEPLQSMARTLAAEDWVLHLVASGLVKRATDLPEVLALSLMGRFEPGWIDEVSQSLESLISGRLITLDQQAGLVVSAVGQAVAEMGLAVTEATELLELFEKDRSETRLGWLALVLNSESWALPPGIISRSEVLSGGVLRMFYERFGQPTEELRLIAGGTGSDSEHKPLSYRQGAALKALLLLDDWCRGLSVRKLEERYQLHLGQIITLGGAVAHLMAGLASLIGAGERDSVLPGMLRRETFSLKFGLPVEMEGLFRKLGSLLTRQELVKLYREGITTPGDLVDISSEEWERMIGNKDKMARLVEMIDNLREEFNMSAAQANGMPMLVSQPGSIEVDGTYEGERYQVKIDGFPVMLTGKSFKYFARLAWSRINRDSGWIYKEDIEIGFNQARYMYRMKNEIKAFLNSEWSIVENNRLGYYRLDVPADKIRINCEKLKSHPDWDIRSLFSDNDQAGGESSSAIH